MRNMAKKNSIVRQEDTQIITQPIEVSFFDLAIALLRNEPKRSQEIIRKRFGISQKNPFTLEKIGKEYDITRERVRQIIADSFQRIRERNDENLKRAEEKILFTLQKNYGIMSVAGLTEALSQGNYKEANSVAFFGSLSNEILVVEEDKALKKVWAASEEVVRKVNQVGNIAVEVLQKEKKLFIEKEIVKQIMERLSFYPNGEEVFSRDELVKYLEVLKLVQKNQFEKWGLASWKEVSLKGTRERVYLVLKEINEPLHFTQIAQYIDKYGLGKRKAHPQTVHNELIKDDRFVLVGRGIYALKECGYQQGTIRDVLRDILLQSKKSLKKQEILDRVLKIRKVKKSTIMINLNNSRFFVKENNSYSIRK